MIGGMGLTNCRREWQFALIPSRTAATGSSSTPTRRVAFPGLRTPRDEWSRVARNSRSRSASTRVAASSLCTIAVTSFMGRFLPEAGYGGKYAIRSCAARPAQASSSRGSMSAWIASSTSGTVPDPSMTRNRSGSAAARRRYAPRTASKKAAPTVSSTRFHRPPRLPLPSGPSRVMNRPRLPALGISPPALAPGLALVGEELDAPVRLRPARAAHEVVSLGQLVLQASHIGVLRRQLDGPARGLHEADRLRRLAQCSLLRVGLQVVKAGQHVLHLQHGVRLEHVDRHAGRLGVAQRRGLAA